MRISTYIIDKLRETQTIDDSTKFIIAKSSNYNILNFKIKDNIINQVWFMWEKLGDSEKKPPQEEVTFIEKTMAYGINYLSDVGETKKFTLSGYPNLPLIINQNQVYFDNNKLLYGIYIHMDENSILPAVKGMTIVYRENDLDGFEYIENK